MADRFDEFSAPWQTPRVCVAKEAPSKFEQPTLRPTPKKKDTVFRLKIHAPIAVPLCPSCSKENITARRPMGETAKPAEGPHPTWSAAKNQKPSGTLPPSRDPARAIDKGSRKNTPPHWRDDHPPSVMLPTTRIGVRKIPTRSCFSAASREVRINLP